MNYFVKDHVGSVRAVFDDSDIVRQVTQYYPSGVNYGEEAEDQTELTYQDYLYGGKEFNRRFEINMSDFGARNYDATRGQWTTVDPLAEKYYYISPYAYCVNNPMNRIDPDGRLIVFTNEAKEDPKFVSNFTKAVQYLNSKGAGGELKSLNDSREIYYIGKANGDYGQYDANNKTISWNPNLGLKTDKGNMLSPTTILNHEVGHAFHDDKDHKQYANDIDPIKGYDIQFGTKEERKTIQNEES